MLSKTIDLKVMYIKWIVCQVNKDKRQVFSDAQEKWKEAAKVTGFLGQTGGWDLKNSTQACIISFWDSKVYSDNFMKNVHDHIFNGNKQAETYESININYFNNKLKIKGKSESLGTAIKMSKLLSIEECTLKPEKSDHFEKVRKSILMKGMNESKGFLYGVLSKSETNTPNYLVSTFWDGIENYHNDLNNKLPDFQEKKTLHLDIKTVKVRQIALVDSWKIIK